ncbi:hypothetical protein [Microbacterium album]|uniref:Uncharacterized protein n=1 Tax=Microbacterium album TaxID=2053191 RepID=A0A917IEN7_9MICO|nr:hypothetical protein [Microbacterium album]GGH42221.1 hypothetical protein GCM10010921_15300 [Microbacterium album]
MNDVVRLTDDEIIAAAVELGGEWKGVLPTVDVEDRGELERAAARGVRSFMVRQLIDEGPDGLPSEDVRRLVRPGVGAVARAVLFPSEQEDPLKAGGAWLTVFAADEHSRAVVVTSSAGISELQLVDADHARRVVAGFIELRAPAVTLLMPSSPERGNYAIVAGDLTDVGDYAHGQLEPPRDARRPLGDVLPAMLADL